MTVVEHPRVLGDPLAQSGLSYLEREADSDTVTVYLHGLGLDARDYKEFLSDPDRGEHGLAPTLLGFEQGSHLPPVPIDTHVHLVSEFVKKVAEQYPDKHLTVVGFSLGADMILRLAEHWQQNPEAKPKVVDSLLLLDPNINESTMAISKQVIDADTTNLEPTFQQISGLAPGDPLLKKYLEIIKTKDFAQLQQLARDTLGYWPRTGHKQIGQRLASASQVATRVRAVFSKDYGNDFGTIKDSAQAEGASNISFAMIKGGHFDLNTPARLDAELASTRLPTKLTNTPPSGPAPNSTTTSHPGIPKPTQSANSASKPDIKLPPR